jgi:tungstate transport system ATP-binding protein
VVGSAHLYNRPDRRVALAAWLVLQPEVLLLDELTTSVDAASVQLLKEAALQAHRQWGFIRVLCR